MFESTVNVIWDASRVVCVLISESLESRWMCDMIVKCLLDTVLNAVVMIRSRRLRQRVICRCMRTFFSSVRCVSLAVSTTAGLLFFCLLFLSL